eukprot:scaffold3056_cov187-Alexandrium_tamarense.AAC.4
MDFKSACVSTNQLPGMLTLLPPTTRQQWTGEIVTNCVSTTPKPTPLPPAGKGNQTTKQRRSHPSPIAARACQLTAVRVTTQ